MSMMKLFLRPNDLKPGMIIAEDLIENNIVLASKGTIITQAIIDKLSQIYFLNKSLYNKVSHLFVFLFL